MKIKAFFFDIDGTLYDHKVAQEYAINELSIIANRLTDIPAELFKERFYIIYNEVINLNDAGNINIFNKEIVLEKLFNISSYKVDKNLIKFLARKYYEKILEKTIAFEDAEQTLIFLKNCGFKIGVISDGLRKIQIKRLKKLRLLNLFDTIVISEDVGVNKPSPKIFLEAFKRLNVSPQESVMVGDNLVKDLKTAKRLGTLTIWVKRSMTHPLDYNKKIDYVDFIIKDLREICVIVKCHKD
jgi:putative hydrolase of the HAD superfamily